MSNKKSVLRFEEYIVKEVEFKYNMEYDQEGDIEVEFDVDVSFEVEENDMFVTLYTSIFEESFEYPFSMKITVMGHFRYYDEDGKGIEYFKPNAVAILYPYVRAIVSSYTANANVAPLILPTINVNSFIKNKRKKQW